MNTTNEHIRNFSIIAHIDHGKSTLADRLLEMTHSIEERKMREQVLDAMDLERERGITIKMTPATMRYTAGGTSYKLNLIDTPGHIDFAYEVSRSLKAVEGSLLLVDATQGVQAQTLSTLETARELGLVIVPVVSKIDAPAARPDEVAEEIARLLSCSPEEVVRVSGKTGEGVGELLDAIVERIPAPHVQENDEARGLVFDFGYSSHRGIVVHVRVLGGSISEGDNLELAATGITFKVLEVGYFTPDPQASDRLSSGEIGYIVTGIKEAGQAVVGDTIRATGSETPPLEGYRQPQPVVWASLYPESQDDFTLVRQALERLKLSDASLSFEEEHSPALGRGFRCGFLGMLHLEIVAERLRREFNLALIITSPSTLYEIEKKDGSRERIYTPAQFPDHGQYEAVYEPYVDLRVIMPEEYLGSVMQLIYTHEATASDSDAFSGNRIALSVSMPLRELMRGFFDELKRVSSGYASFSYELAGYHPADVVRLDILVAEERVPALSQVVSKARAYEEAKKTVEQLYELLPRQQFQTKIQGAAFGRVVASKTLPALRKDVTAPLYGGDVTRKKKLLEKQKKGKKKLAAHGAQRVDIPHEVFLKMLKEK